MDREERSDVDAIYMEAVQAVDPGRMAPKRLRYGGQVPFFGGTYSPPVDALDAGGQDFTPLRTWW